MRMVIKPNMGFTVSPTGSMIMGIKNVKRRATVYKSHNYSLMAISPLSH